MTKNCLNRKCILLNLAYNLAINNFFSGISTMFHLNIEEITGAIILIGLGFLLIIGLRKEDRSIILTFLIMESFVLISKLIETSHNLLKNIHKENLNIIKILMFVGVIASLLLLVPVYIIYRDLNKNKENDNEPKNVTI